jgi:hypothetical protein
MNLEESILVDRLEAVLPQAAAKIERLEYCGQDPNPLYRVPVWREPPTSVEAASVQRIVDGFFGEGRRIAPLCEIVEQISRLSDADRRRAIDLAAALVIQQNPEAFRLAGLAIEGDRSTEGDRPAADDSEGECE